MGRRGMLYVECMGVLMVEGNVKREGRKR